MSFTKNNPDFYNLLQLEFVVYLSNYESSCSYSETSKYSSFS